MHEFFGVVISLPGESCYEDSEPLARHHCRESSRHHIHSCLTQADIDRILKERGKGARKQYLCSWMDGAEPQWVAAKYLADTVALEEWEEVLCRPAHIATRGGAGTFSPPH